MAADVTEREAQSQDREMVRRLAGLGYLAALMMLVDHGGDLLVTIGAIDIRSAVWRVQMADGVATRMIAFLAADLAILVAAALLEQRRVLRVWKVGQIVLGVGLVAVLVTTFRDAGAMFPSVPLPGVDEFRRHAVRTLVVLGVVAPVFILAGLLLGPIAPPPPRSDSSSEPI